MISSRPANFRETSADARPRRSLQPSRQESLGHRRGFEDPKGETHVIDQFGDHTINVNKPAFLCGDPQNSPLICFKDDEISCSPTPPGGTCLPPNTDRNEDVCATATVM